MAVREFLIRSVKCFKVDGYVVFCYPGGAEGFPATNSQKKSAKGRGGCTQRTSIVIIQV